MARALAPPEKSCACHHKDRDACACEVRQWVDTPAGPRFLPARHDGEDKIAAARARMDARNAAAWRR